MWWKLNIDFSFLPKENQYAEDRKGAGWAPALDPSGFSSEAGLNAGLENVGKKRQQVILWRTFTTTKENSHSTLWDSLRPGVMNFTFNKGRNSDVLQTNPTKVEL